MRAQIVKWLGGYATLDEAIDSMRAKDGAERRAVLTLAVRRLYSTIGAEDILRRDAASGQWMYAGKPIAKEETAVLIEQAKAMLDSKLWKVLQTDLKYQANKRMYIDSQDMVDLVAGKLILLYIDIIHTRLKTLAGF